MDFSSQDRLYFHRTRRGTVASIYHPATGFDVGEPACVPLDAKALPGAVSIREAASSLILSASGWRKVFADPLPGDPVAPWSAEDTATEDSLSARISASDTVLAALMAHVFGEFLLRTSPSRPCVLLGIDTRPTGPAIADAFARVFLGMGIQVRYCFIIAAPELMAYAGQGGKGPEGDDEGVSGFAYISASHNPPGHNGVKFGLTSGGVLNAAQITPLINRFKEEVAGGDPSQKALSLLAAADTESVAACYRSCTAWKRLALSAYTLFTHEVVTGKTELEEQCAVLDEIAAACAARPLGVVAELNGSARTVSIDADFLEGLSVKSHLANEHPRAFARRIVPERESLEPCMRLLDKTRQSDPSFQIGYAPDCDGDRGNLVFYDNHKGESRILDAQEVFSLACLAELAGLARATWTGSDTRQKIAVVVNDATSMRIEKIAGYFGASVFRAETGEANVVNRAEEARAAGWTVRILGEGSNGGTITHPSKVRDPLSMIGAMIRLLRTPDTAAAPSLYRIWLKACGREKDYRDGYDLSDVIASLPTWITTSTFETRAALKVGTRDKRELKKVYSSIFPSEWESRKVELKTRFGITGWKALATNGMVEREIGLDFAASGSGGLRIIFLKSDGSAVAFIWMRGSGTEPVFRIMADVDGGSQADEEYFLSWHRAMVEQADTPGTAAGV